MPEQDSVTGAAEVVTEVVSVVVVVVSEDEVVVVSLEEASVVSIAGRTSSGRGLIVGSTPLSP